MTYALAGEIFRAMQGDQSLWHTIMLEDVLGLRHADTFAAFVDTNRDNLQLFDAEDLDNSALL
jgi:hypothetical protein